MYLPTPELQKAVLKNIHEQIEDGGILTLNIFDPFPEYQTSQMASSPDDYKFRLEYINSNGKREKIYNAVTYNPILQLMYGNWKLETYDENKK